MENSIKTVYRIEHTKTKKGPYATQGIGIAYKDSWASASQPMPRSDGINRTYSIGRFGFSTIDDLTSWFPQHVISDLHAKGFEIAIYNIPKEFIEVGGSQVLFEKVEAEKVGVVDEASLY